MAAAKRPFTRRQQLSSRMRTPWFASGCRPRRQRRYGIRHDDCSSSSCRKHRSSNNGPVFVGDHRAERNGYYAVVTAISRTMRSVCSVRTAPHFVAGWTMATILFADDGADTRIAEAGGRRRRVPGTRRADGKEAVEVFQSERPDVAILDIWMPRANGFDAAERMVARIRVWESFFSPTTMNSASVPHPRSAFAAACVEKGERSHGAETRPRFGLGPALYSYQLSVYVALAAFAFAFSSTRAVDTWRRCVLFIWVFSFCLGLYLLLGYLLSRICSARYLSSPAISAGVR